MLNLNQRGLVAHRRENINLLRETEKAVLNALINGEPEKVAAIIHEAKTDDVTHSIYSIRNLTILSTNLRKDITDILRAIFQLLIDVI